MSLTSAFARAFARVLGRLLGLPGEARPAPAEHPDGPVDQERPNNNRDSPCSPCRYLADVGYDLGYRTRSLVRSALFMVVASSSVAALSYDDSRWAAAFALILGLVWLLASAAHLWVVHDIMHGRHQGFLVSRVVAFALCTAVLLRAKGRLGEVSVPVALTISAILVLHFRKLVPGLSATRPARGPRIPVEEMIDENDELV